MLGTHQTIVFEFSGGKDSLACLYLLRPYWERITVLWCNTGDAFPETIEQMEGVKQLVPHFVEVRSDQPTQIAEWGVPTDLLPVWATPLGRAVRRDSPYRAQAAFDCCRANIWAPMERTARRLGATMIARGQRRDEQLTAPLRSGDVVEGIEYLFPIETWTRGMVDAYLADSRIPVPANYELMDTSLDCQHCTAYLFQQAGKMTYLKRNHPKVHERVWRTLDGLRRAQQAEHAHITHALTEAAQE